MTIDRATSMLGGALFALIDQAAADDSDSDSDGSGGGGSDLSAIGTYVTNVPAWGLPGFVDPAVPDGSGNWLALTSQAYGYTELVLGFGASGAYYIDAYVTALQATLQVNGGAGTGLLMQSTATRNAFLGNAQPGQTQSLLTLKDDAIAELFSVTPSGADDGTGAVAVGSTGAVDLHVTGDLTVDGAFPGIDLSAIGTYVTNVPAWGEPGFEYGSDDSAGWLAMKTAADNADLTVGFGSDGNHYADVYVRSDSAEIGLGAGASAAKLAVADGYAALTINSPTGQTTPSVAVVDSNDTPLFSVIPSGADDGTGTITFLNASLQVLATGATISQAHAEPLDASLSSSSFTMYLDDTPGATTLHIKAKDSAGTVRTATVPLA